MSAAPGERGISWTPAELATLTELADTFVELDPDRVAGMAAEALDVAADPAQRAQLALVLRMMASRPANLLLSGRPTTFGEMTPAERERYLLGWATSRLPLRRSAFQALRKLLTFLAYADPGDGVPNPLHARIGYRPDHPPVTPDVAAITPFVPSPPMALEADVVVVGSGAGGGVIAAALAEAGRSVVVLETGPYADETAMPADELAAFDRLYLDHGLLTTWDGSVTMLAGSGVGGGTLVNWMTSIEAPSDVRASWASDHGLDGVEDGAAWSAEVAAIEADLGVAEATQIPPKDAVILRGCRALGWEAAPIRRNAVMCGDCGSCPFGCRRGTKQSGIRVHLARAAAAGARIVAEAEVRSIVMEGGRAAGVEAVMAAGVRMTVRAPQVVLAAGALRTPAILQRTGVAHPAIGRHLRLHPVSVVAGWFDDPIEMWRGTMQAARSVEFGVGGAGRNGYTIESAPGHPGLMALALPWEGREAHARVMADSARIAPLIAVTRDGGEGRLTLTRAGRVRVDYRLDATGVATLRHGLARMAEITRAAGATGIVALGTPPRWYGSTGRGTGAANGVVSGREGAAFERFVADLGAFDFGPNRGTVFSAHQMGSVRMGADAATHPCDPWGRVRRGPSNGPERVVGGLYVGDGSLFPTGIGVNPMVTIMALARRVSRTILSES